MKIETRENKITKRKEQRGEINTEQKAQRNINSL